MKRLSRSESTRITRSVIFETATRLFAKHGIDAVSIRQINEQSGQQNTSALYYHFGNKLRLIESILAKLASAYEVERERCFEELSNAPRRGRRQFVERIIRIELMPLLLIYSQSEWGKYAITLFARMHSEANKETRLLMDKYSEVALSRILKELSGVLPGLPSSVLKMRIALCFTNLLHTLANMEVMKDNAFFDFRTQTREEFGNAFIDIWVGAMLAPVTQRTNRLASS